eukprot:gene14905-20954_t
MGGSKSKPVTSGSCTCGAVQLETVTNPIISFECHCSVCRDFYKSKSAAGNAFWTPAVIITKGKDKLEITKTFQMGGCTGLERSRCSSCKCPVIAKGIRGYTGLCFIPKIVLANEPKIHVFVNSGEGGDTGNLPCIKSDAGSLLYTTVLFLTFGMIQWPKIIFKRLARFFRKKKAVKPSPVKSE